MSKEYELAIKIAGKVDATLTSSAGLTKKQLRDIAREASTVNQSMKSNLQASISDMDKGYEKISRVAKKAFQIIGTAALAAGTATTMLLGKATEVGKSFEKQMSGVKAISNSTREEMLALTNKAKEMGATTVFTSQDAGKAMEYMAMAGWKTKDMLSGIEGVMNLASASGEELAVVSDIVTGNLAAFGLKAEQAGRFADVLAMASTNSKTNVSMMGEALKYAAPIAGSLGYSIEDTSFAIGLMANNNIQASQAGTQLKNILSTVATGVELTGKSFGKMNIKATNADGSMRALSDVLTDLRDGFGKMTEQEQVLNSKNLFGTRAMAGMLAIVNASQEDWDKLANAISKSANAAENMSKIKLDNLEGDNALKKSAEEALGINIYDDIKKPLREYTQLYTEEILKFDKFNSRHNFIKNISENFVKTIPILIRESRKAGKAFQEFVSPLISLGGFFVKNPTIITSTLKGIIAAMITYKTISTGFHIGEGISSLMTALANPTTATIAGIMATVGAITAIAEAVRVYNKELGAKELKKNFGNITLSLKELKEVSKYLAGGRNIDKINEIGEAFAKVGESLDVFAEANRTLNKLNWQVGLGMDLSFLEKEKYKNAVEDLVNNTSQALLDEQYAMSLSLDFFANDDETGRQLKEQFSNFYDQNQSKLEALGKQLNETVTEAFNDDLLTIDESKKIAELQKQIATIQGKLAESENSAKYAVLQDKALRNLDSDSYMNLISEFGEQHEEYKKQTEQEAVKLIQSLDLQKQDGLIDDSEYKKQVAYVLENKNEKVTKDLVQGYSAIVEAGNSSYTKQLEKLLPIAKKTAEAGLERSMSSDEQKALWEANASEQLSNMMSYAKGQINVDNATKQAAKQVWDAIKPTQEELMSIQKEYQEAGKEVPAYIEKGIQEGMLTGLMAGDEGAIWYLFGQQAKNDESYSTFLKELYDKGYKIPDEMVRGMASNNNINSAVTDLHRKVSSNLSTVFKNPFDVSAKFNIIPEGYAAMTPKGLQEASRQASRIKHYASGGIIENPTLATFAENGPEAAIPLDGSNRSKSLWALAGQRLGIKTSGAEQGLEKLSTGGKDIGVNITYSPVNHFDNGTISKNDLIEAESINQRSFEKMFENMMRKKGSVSFA